MPWVLNRLDRFHLVLDAITYLPQLGESGAALKRLMQDKLVEHKQYVDKNGLDLPEIRNWKWDPKGTPVEKKLSAVEK